MGKVRLSAGERKRLEVLKKIERGGMSLRGGAALLLVGNVRMRKS